MTAPRTDVESGALHKRERGCKVTLFVALQNLVLTGCLLVALFFHRTPPETQEIEDVHIQFDAIAGPKNTLEFDYIRHQNKMDVSEDKSRISTQCSGPYIVHMYVCYDSTKGEARGSLELKVVGNPEPLDSFKLNTTEEHCRGLQRVVYLSMDEEVKLQLVCDDYFRIRNVTVGFNYLLRRCI